MWNKPICAGLVFAAALPCASLAEAMRQPFRTDPVLIAELAMALAEGDAMALRENTPDLTAAVAALLLVSEIGLAEAYEAAVEGDDDAEEEAADPYGLAYARLQTVHALIDTLPAARGSADVAAIRARLDALMPGEQRPERFDADPEAAEVLAHALVGVLERETGAELYLGRDLDVALETVAALSAQGCAPQGRDPDAARSLRAAAFYYEDSLEAPLSVMVPDAAATIKAAFDTLAGTPAGSEACAALSAGIQTVAQTLFPEVGQ